MEGGVLASPAQATSAGTSGRSDMWQRPAGGDRGMAMPSRVVETGGITRVSSKAWFMSPHWPQTPCPGLVLRALMGHRGRHPARSEDVCTLLRVPI